MSAVWRYFRLEGESSATATCDVCKLVISRGGEERAAFNTTNLIRHLKKKIGSGLGIGRYSKSYDSELDRGQKKGDRDISNHNAIIRQPAVPHAAQGALIFH